MYNVNVDDHFDMRFYLHRCISINVCVFKRRMMFVAEHAQLLRARNFYFEMRFHRRNREKNDDRYSMSTLLEQKCEFICRKIECEMIRDVIHTISKIHVEYKSIHFAVDRCLLNRFEFFSLYITIDIKRARNCIKKI